MATSTIKKPKQQWERITPFNATGQNQIDGKYTDVFVEAEFNSGQKIGFHLPLVADTILRIDSGFYYNNLVYGAGAAISQGHKVEIYKPYYGGSETTYKTVRAYGKWGG